MVLLWHRCGEPFEAPLFLKVHFYIVFTNFLKLEHFLRNGLSMEGLKYISFHLKYLHLCFEDEQISYGFEVKVK